MRLALSEMLGPRLSLAGAALMGGQQTLGRWADGAYFAYDATKNKGFVNYGRRLVPLTGISGISITRATTGYALTQQGQLVQFPSGAARITDRGLLVEGAATNLFLNSTAPVTQDINFASTGQRTLSVWGSGSVAVAQNSATITGAGTATQGSPVTFNVTATGTCTFTVTGTPTIVQVEATAYATSPIVTAGASATRNADVIVGSVTGLSYPVTLFAEFERASDTGAIQVALCMDGGSAADRTRLDVNASDLGQIIVAASSVTQATVTVAGAIANNTVYRLAGRVNTNSVQAALSGTLGTEDTSVTLPGNPTTIRLGTSTSAGNELNGYLRRLAILPTAYTDAQLQALAPA